MNFVHRALHHSFSLILPCCYSPTVRFLGTGSSQFPRIFPVLELNSKLIDVMTGHFGTSLHRFWVVHRWCWMVKEYNLITLKDWEDFSTLLRNLVSSLGEHSLSLATAALKKLNMLDKEEHRCQLELILAVSEDIIAAVDTKPPLTQLRQEIREIWQRQVLGRQLDARHHHALRYSVMISQFRMWMILIMRSLLEFRQYNMEPSPPIP